MPTSDENQKIKYEYITRTDNQYVINREMIGKNLKSVSNYGCASKQLIIKFKDIRPVQKLQLKIKDARNERKPKEMFFQFIAVAKSKDFKDLLTCSKKF